MKKIYIALGLFIVFLVIALITNNNVNHMIDALKEQANTLAQDVLNKDWKKAKSEVNELNEKWKIESDKLGILLNHETLENATLSIKKVKKYVELEMQEEAIVELEGFYFTLDIVDSLEIIKLKNIL